MTQASYWRIRWKSFTVSCEEDFSAWGLKKIDFCFICNYTDPILVLSGILFAVRPDCEKMTVLIRKLSGNRFGKGCFCSSAIFVPKKTKIGSVYICHVHKTVQEGGNMRAVSYTSARSNLAKTMMKVCEDHEPVIITRKSCEHVVMISLKDYELISKTAYLLRSPKNAKRLMSAIEELDYNV